jgi:hypothetical protein
LNGVASPLLDAQAITDGTFGDRNTTIGAQNVERDALPDWILLDVFKVGSAATFDGRINLNTRFTGPAAALTPRTVPLAALINESTVNLAVGGSAEGQLNTIAGNIANRVPAVGSPYGGLLAYFTPGEICEIRDLEFFDDTVSGTAAYNQRPSKTRRQQLVRRVSNLVTARSNAFTIWALAQTIKEVGTPDGIFNGQDFVTGEVKVQAIVERYEDPPGLDGILGNTDDVKFRTKYLRYVYE